MHHLSVDIETFSSVDIKKGGLHKYVQAADFQIMLFAYSWNSGPVQIIDLARGEQLPPEIVFALQDPNVIKHAYNAPFEVYCLNKIYYSPVNQWRCTMLHGLYCGYTAGLAATAAALGLPEDKRKMGIGSALIRTFCAPCKPTAKNGNRTRTLPHHEPEKWQLFKQYCIQDVVTEMEIEKRLSAFPVPEKEQRLWELDQHINALGVSVDMELVEGALYCDELITAELMSEAVKLSGLENPKSVKQLSKWLTEETGEEITDLQKGTVSKLIDSIDSAKAKRMLEIRQELAKTSTKKYVAMVAALCGDGRIRGLLQFYGANRTGRWAGRLVQIQNLPRNYLETLSHARGCVKGKKIDTLRLIYGNIPDTLSQLIRTAFVPSPGNVLLVADFSAIEARIIAWLAGEQWRLEVFATHGKIYEASASAMFGVPIGLIKKGNPEYELRQKGKVAELGLGYAGGVGALISMGALDMGLKEEELPEIVRRWRSANKRIVDLWYSLENAALEVMRTGQPVGIRELILAREADYNNQQDFFTIKLPSGRKLYYPKPFLHQNNFGKEALHYYGVDQNSKKWGVISTYGGKLVENCLAGDTKVLTNQGWHFITEVKRSHLLWDGCEWVTHSGVIEKGVQSTIELDGVRMTKDHLVLTETGWRSASSCEGYHRAQVLLPGSSKVYWLRREKITLGDKMRLRKNNHNACQRVQEGQTKIMRLSTIQISFRESKHSRYVSPSGFCGVAVNDRPVQPSYSPGMAQLRGPRDKCVPGMGRELRGILGRYGANIPPWSYDRKKGCERELHSRKLLLGNIQKASPKQAQQSNHSNTMGANDGSRSFRTLRDRKNNFALPIEMRLPRKPFILRTGRNEQVYDILNAGPRKRFTVMGYSGPFIVHNCVQAIARDCLAESLLRVNALGFQTVMHVHDEVVLEVPKDQADLKAVCEIMGQPLPWAPDLLLSADGFITEFYKKD